LQKFNYFRPVATEYFAVLHKCELLGENKLSRAFRCKQSKLIVIISETPSILFWNTQSILRCLCFW